MKKKLQKYFSKIITILTIVIIAVSSFSVLNLTLKTSITNAASCNNDTNCDPGETIFSCPSDCLDPGIPSKSISDILDATISWILGLGIALSVIFLIWGGLNYVASSGDAQKTEKAKKIIKYSILGVLIMGISFAIIFLIDKLLA